MVWQIVTIIVLAAACLLFLGLYLFFFTMHWRSLRREFSVKSLFNEAAKNPLKNSRTILEKLAEARDGEPFKDSAAFVAAVDRQIGSLLNDARDQIKQLELQNIGGEYGNAKRYARQLQKKMALLAEAVKELAKEIGTPSAANNILDEILVVYRKHYEEATSLYESRLVTDSDNRAIQGLSIACSQLLSSFEDDKFKMSDAQSVELLSRLHEAVHDLCVVIYKTPKIKYLNERYVPERIVSIEQKALEAQRKGVIADFVWIKDLLAEINARRKHVQKLIKSWDVEESEAVLVEAISMLDLIQNVLDQESGALELLGGLGRFVVQIVSKTLASQHFVSAALATIAASEGFNKELKDDFQNVIDGTARLFALNREVEERANLQTRFSELCEMLCVLAKQMLLVQGSLEKAMKGLQTHAQARIETSVDVANLRLTLYDLNELVANHPSEAVRTRLQATVLSQRNELAAVEAAIAAGTTDAAWLKEKLSYSQEIVSSLLVQANAFQVEENVAELLIVYVNKYRNEDPAIALALTEAENDFARGEYERSLDALMPVVANIKRSASANRLKMS